MSIGLRSPSSAGSFWSSSELVSFPSRSEATSTRQRSGGYRDAAKELQQGGVVEVDRVAVLSTVLASCEHLAQQPAHAVPVPMLARQFFFFLKSGSSLSHTCPVTVSITAA
jgi:hypothetical protein